MQPGCCGLATCDVNPGSLASQSMDGGRNVLPDAAPTPRPSADRCLGDVGRAKTGPVTSWLQLVLSKMAVVWMLLASFVSRRAPEHSRGHEEPSPALPVLYSPLRSILKKRRSRSRRRGLRTTFSFPSGHKPRKEARPSKLDPIESGRFLPADTSVHPGLRLDTDRHRTRRDPEHCAAIATRDAWELAWALGFPLPGIHWPVVQQGDRDYHYLPYADVITDPKTAFKLGRLHLDYPGPPLDLRRGSPGGDVVGVPFLADTSAMQKSETHSDSSENEDDFADAVDRPDDLPDAATVLYPSDEEGPVPEWQERPLAMLAGQDADQAANSEGPLRTFRTWLMDTGGPFDLVSRHSVQDISKYIRRQSRPMAFGQPMAR